MEFVRLTRIGPLGKLDRFRKQKYLYVGQMLLISNLSRGWAYRGCSSVSLQFPNIRGSMIIVVLFQWEAQVAFGSIPFPFTFTLKPAFQLK